MAVLISGTAILFSLSFVLLFFLPLCALMAWGQQDYRARASAHGRL